MCVLQATTYKVTIYVLHLSEHVLPAALGCLNIHAVRIWTSYSINVVSQRVLYQEFLLTDAASDSCVTSIV